MGLTARIRSWQALPQLSKLRQGLAQIIRLEPEGTRLALVGDATIRIDQVNTVGPAGVSLFGRVVELVQNSGKLDSQFAHASASDESSLVFILGAGKNNVVADVAFHLPHVAGVRFDDVDSQKGYVVAVLLVKLVEGGNLPPEGRSSVAAKDQDDRPFSQ